MSQPKQPEARIRSNANEQTLAAAQTRQDAATSQIWQRIKKCAGVLDTLSKFSILLGISVFIWNQLSISSHQRGIRKRTVFEAWQVINTAAGKGGNGGVDRALGELMRLDEPLAAINLENVYLPEFDLSGRDLRGGRLAGANMTNGEFQNSNLTGVNLNGGVFANASFRHADMTRVDASPGLREFISRTSPMTRGGDQIPHVEEYRTDLSGADFLGATLTLSDFTRANLQKANLKNASLSQVSLREADLQHANLEGTDLGEAVLDDADLTDAKLRHARLVGATMNESNLTNADLTGVDLNGANLKGADLRGADIAGARNLDQINNLLMANIANIRRAPDGFLVGARKKGAVEIVNTDKWLALKKIRGGFYYGAVDVSGLSLPWLNLARGVVGKGAVFRDVDLSNGNLSRIQIEDASFVAASLVNCDFVSADLRGSDFTEADVQGANFRGADLRNANLRDLKNWDKIKSIKDANIHGIKNAPERFVAWANEAGALTIESDKDWRKLRYGHTQ